MFPSLSGTFHDDPTTRLPEIGVGYCEPLLLASASVKGAGVSFKTEEISQEQDESEVKGRSDVFSFDDHTVAMFKYRDGTPGQIVFSKTAITMQAPWDVKAFAEKDPRFPTNSTADQLYTDERFEAYRALGWFTADHAVNSMRGGP